jgi:integrase
LTIIFLRSPPKNNLRLIYRLIFYLKLILFPQRFFIKKIKKLPLVLNKEEVEKILNLVHNIKHKAILVFIYSSGLRVGEAVNMER